MQFWTSLCSAARTRRVLVYAKRHPSPFQQCKSLWKPRVRHLATPNRAVRYTHTNTQGLLLHTELISLHTSRRHLSATAEDLVNLRHISKFNLISWLCTVHETRL